MPSRFTGRMALRLASLTALIAGSVQQAAAQASPASPARPAAAPLTAQTDATPTVPPAPEPQPQVTPTSPATPAPAPVTSAVTSAAPEAPSSERLDTIERQLALLSHLKLTGYVQAQYVHNGSSAPGLDASGKPLNKDEFEVRRARLRATYRQGPAELVFNLDAIPSGVSIKEAEVSLYLPTGDSFHSEVTAGLFYIPFGYEVQESDSVLPFVERTQTANRLFPGSRDLGLRVQGDGFAKLLTYQVALMNGQPVGDAVFPALDPNGAKDLVGRIGTTVVGFRAGISGLWGTGYLPKVADDPTTTSIDEAHDYVNFTHRAAAFDLSYEWQVPVLGSLALYAEGTLGHNLDRSKLADYPKITRITSSARTVAGKDVIDANQIGGYIGALQHVGRHVALGARGELFDPNSASSGDILGALTLVGHVLPVEPVRLTVAYQLNLEKPAVANDVFWLRAQVKF